MLIENMVDVVFYGEWLEMCELSYIVIDYVGELVEDNGYVIMIVNEFFFFENIF